MSIADCAAARQPVRELQDVADALRTSRGLAFATALTSSQAYIHEDSSGEREADEAEQQRVRKRAAIFWVREFFFDPLRLPT
jgi:hypothetical protein